MDAFMIRNEDGTMESVPAAQFELSRTQQFLVIGIDFTATGYRAESVPGVDVVLMGKLSEVNVIFQCQVINSLEKMYWNFIKYPDPFIIMMTDNRVDIQQN